MMRLITTFVVLCCLPCATLQADILDTKHNLTSKTEGDQAASAEDRKRLSREVCVFCHTPGLSDLNAEDETAAGHVPPVAAWQRSVEATFSFELFDDIGRMGADGSGVQPVGSVSVACLSCHDAVQAFAVSQGSSSDHPFGVPYRGLSRLGQSGSQFRDRVLSTQGDIPSRMAGYVGDDSEFRPARSGVVNKRQVWWAAVSDTGQRTKNDLPLYPRKVDGAGGYEQVPFVECTSCHDPHSSRPVFLRTDNDQSKLCMTCHIK
jgi:predicted CXXCH cytochrome family protein